MGAKAQEQVRHIKPEAIHQMPKISLDALETLCTVVEYYKEKPDYVLDVVNIASAYNKKLGRYNLMMAQNPIYIITAVKKD